MCPPFAHHSVQVSCQDVQEQVRSFLDGNPPTNAVLERSQLCNECYLCVTDTCPQGLDPMRTNQLLRGLLHTQGVVSRPFIPPSDPGSNERIIASLLTTEEEYSRITTPKVKGDGRVLFFPGCNIYYQPNLLLTALDVLELIAEDWSFLPGLDHCCGSNHDSSGYLTAGTEAMEGLSARIKEVESETVVVWCSTCAARFQHAESDLPVITFARLLSDRLGDFLKGRSISGSVTLHEVCKMAYLGMDTDAPRKLLNLVAGEPVKEMTRHGRDTVCCGWILHQVLPDEGDKDRNKRLAEATATGAEVLATICHGCQWVLDKPGADSHIRIVNYIRLVGETLGIHHRERFRELREMGNHEDVMVSIQREMGGRFVQLPFDRGQIMRAVEILLGSCYGREI
jgi:Fe-S oxidoreductase